MPALLVVNDSTDICEPLIGHVSHRGYECRHARSTRTALALPAKRAYRFDAAIVDLLLEDKPGTRVVQACFSHCVPVLLFTNALEQGVLADQLLAEHMC